MKISVSFYDFERAFADADRKENFSYSALRVLFDYLEEYEQSTGEEIELDVVALCCEYSEDHWEDVAANYSNDLDLSECEDDEEKIEAVRDYLNENTLVCGESAPGVFVYAVF